MSMSLVPLGLGLTSSLVGAQGSAAPAGTFVPTGLSVAPQMAYGMAKLFSSYSGLLASGTRRSDSAAGSIPIGANQQADITAFTTFVSGTTFDGDTFYDQAYVVNGGSINTNDAKQTNASFKPSIFVANNWNGRQPFTTGIIGGSGATSGLIGSRYLDRPAVANARQAVTHFWVGLLGGGTFDSCGVSGLGTSGTSTLNLDVLYDTTAQLRALGNAFVGGKLPPAAQPVVITTISSASNIRQRLNGVAYTSGAAFTAQALTGGYVGRAGWASATIGPADILADITYAGVLTDPEIAQIEAALATIFDVPLTAATRSVTFDGDSLTCGLNESGFLRNLVRQTGPLLTGARPYLMDYGTSGITTGTLNGRKATTYTQLTGSLYASVTSKAYHLWIGTNDIEALASGLIVGGETTIYTNISTVVTYMTDPTRFDTSGKVAVATIVPRGWTGSTADQSQKEVVRINLNALIRAGASAGHYTVLDYGAIAALTTGPGTAPPNDAAGNVNPPAAAYYGTSTTTHINPTAYALCATIAAAWLNSVL